MSDEGDEIEFLDEDADIVQHCVQIKQEVEDESPEHIIHKPQIITPPLLVERAQTGRPGRPRGSYSVSRRGGGRKRKTSDDDVDYNPTEDRTVRTRTRRRGLNIPKPYTPVRSRKYDVTANYKPFIASLNAIVKHEESKKHMLPLEETNRQDLTIRVPDFDDPLCLPVRAIVKDENDIRRLRHWNNLCLEQFKTYDKMLRPRNDEACSSSRTVVIRNLFNKNTGKTEATFWSKTSVEDVLGETKSDVLQSVLPRYREKKILNTFKLAEVKRHKPVHSKFEVILTKEKDGQEETLVAYKPDESLSLMFKMFQKNSKQYEGTEEENKNYLEEMASCKMCASCYQTSWRGMEKTVKRQVNCQVCGRACINIQNLFKHLKAHTNSEVKRYKRRISNSLAKTLTYHYKCRICQKQFSAIRDLRIHVRDHKGVEPILCEVGNHMVS